MVAAVGESFWPTIALLGGVVSEPGIARLIEELAARGEVAITQFADDLAVALAALDTRAGAAQLVSDVDDPPGSQPSALSEDTFLYVRCSVVAAGRAGWSSIVADPTRIAGRWPVFEGEFLLDVAPRAYERATGLVWDHRSPVDYETGSNPAGWGDLADTQDRREPRNRWLMSGAGFDTDTGCAARPTRVPERSVG